MAIYPGENTHPCGSSDVSEASLNARVEAIAALIQSRCSPPKSSTPSSTPPPDAAGDRRNGSPSVPDVQLTAADSPPGDNKSPDAALDAKAQRIALFIKGSGNRRTTPPVDSLDSDLWEVL